VEIAVNRSADILLKCPSRKRCNTDAPRAHQEAAAAVPVESSGPLRARVQSVGAAAKPARIAKQARRMPGIAAHILELAVAGGPATNADAAAVALVAIADGPAVAPLNYPLPLLAQQRES
jgi:hypothetical protein